MMKRRRTVADFPMIRFNMNKMKVRRVIIDHARKTKSVIYCAQAMNAQLPGFSGRMTYDYDIYTKRPRHVANNIQNRLDMEVAGGEDDFYSKQALHKETHKVMHKGADGIQGTDDDFGIVDYSKIPRKITTIKKDGLIFESLGSIKKGKKMILKDKKSKFRHSKDRDDLKAIASSSILRRRW